MAIDSHPPSPSEALEHAVAMTGSQSAFGRLIERRQSTVSDWIRDHRELPAEHVLRAEGGTGVSRHLLRPDIYPLPVGGAVPSLPEIPVRRRGVACDRRDDSHGAVAA